MPLTPYEGEEVAAPKLTPYEGEEVPAVQKPSLMRRLVADPAISALKGAIGVPEAVVGLADIATQGAAGKAAEFVGFRPKEAKATLDTLYSPEQQRANEAVAQADGIIPTIKASFKNPSTIAHAAIESAPSMLPAGGAAQVLVRRGVPAVIAAATGEGLVSAGQTAEQVRQDTGDLTGTKPLIAAGSGALTGGLGVLGGKAAQKLGIADLDVLLAGGTKPTKTATAKAIAGGVISEGLLEETPQSAQEQAAQNLAEGKPLGEGVAKAAVQGGIVGGAMGGSTAAVANLLTPKSEIKSKTEEIQALPPEEQKPAVADLAVEIAPEAPAHVEAAILDKLDAGEALAPEVEPVTHEKVLDALTESIASGGEIDPMEAMQGAEEQQVLEALRKEVPMETPVAEGEATPLQDVVQIRAQGGIDRGFIPVKEGQAPDAEVAARLDDMGYMLEKGGRADLKNGGSVATREWKVKSKPVALAEGERRQAYPENPNVLIERQGDRVAVFDDKNKEIIGIAETKDGKFSGWVDNFEPMSLEEQGQVRGLVNRHMSGEAKTEKAAPLETGEQGEAAPADTRFSKTPLMDDIKDAKAQVVSKLADQKALAAEAKAQGISVDDLTARLEVQLDQYKRVLAGESYAGLQGRPEAAAMAAHLAPILDKLSVPVQVVGSAAEVPGLQTDVQFSAVYHNGSIFLNAENINSLKEAESLLLEHEIRHAGLRSLMNKQELDALLAAVWGDLDSGVREFAKEKGIDTKTREGKLEAAEEYMVELSTAEPTPLWKKLLNILKQVLRRIGMSVKYTDDELRALVARAGDAMFTGGEGTRFAAAWHGTPHSFDKFSTKNIGTGEGAQAYGWGLYFAGAKEVAQWYKQKLSSDGFGIPTIDSIPVDELTSLSVDAAQMLIVEVDERPETTLNGNEAKAFLLKHLDTFTNPDADIQAAREEAKTRISRTAASLLEVPGRDQTGRLYQVELAPAEDEYLLWDKPLSEQSEKVREALEPVVDFWLHHTEADEDGRTNMTSTMKGERLYNAGEIWDALDEAGAFTYEGDRSVSEYLHSLGIRGIKYADGNSRSKIGYKITWENGQTGWEATRALAEEVAKTFEKRFGKATVEADDKGVNYNYVIFDDEDVEIVSRFSRTPKEAVNDITAKAASQIAARTLSDVSGNIWRAIMPIDRTIKMAQSMGRYQPIWKQLGEYLVHKRAKAAATNAAPTLAHTYVDEFGKAFKTEAEVGAFNDLTAKATLYELHADGRNAGWTEKSWDDAGKKDLTGKTLGEAMTEVKKLYAQLSPTQKAVHGKIIDHMKVLNDQVREAQLEPLKATFGEENFNHALGLAPTLFNLDNAGLEALSKAVGSDVFSLAEQIASIQSEGRLKGDYAPLMRFGDHIVRTFDAEGNRVKTEAFESKLAADNAIQKIRAAGLRPEYEVQAEADRSSTNIPLAFLDKMRAAAEQRGLSGEALDALMDDFKAARLNTLPRYNLAANGLRREGVEGYSTDMLRAYALYTSRAGRSIANLKYGVKIEQTFRDMASAIHAYQDNKSGWTPHAVERMSRLMNDLRHLELQGDSEKINELAKMLGKSTFLWYLSSPSVWAVQWSQPFMTTIPKMAARYGFTRAMGAYLAEAKRYMAGEFSDEKIEEFNSAHENAGERLFALIEEERALRSKSAARMDEFFAETKGLNGIEALQVVTKQKAELKARADGLRKSMRELYNGFDAKGQRLLILKVLGLQGMLDLSSSHMIQDLITGANEGDKALNKIVEKGAFFMQKSETGSRRAAAVSAFQLALEGGRDFMEANDYAANIIDDTLADFSSQNRPQLMRGNVGRIVGQFQFFRFHMLGKVIQLAKDAYKEEGWGEHKKELAYMTGMTAALAGAAGTPLAMVFSNSAVQLVLAGASAAFGDPDDPWDLEHDFSLAVKEALGEEAGNVFLKGLPSLLGMDVSKRIGMGGMANVLQGDPPPGLSATERAQWYASRMLGPSYGLFSDSLRAIDKTEQGDLVGAMAVSSPKVVKDMFKAYQLSNEGARGIGGKTAIQPEDISPTSIALQMLGINPAEVALAQEERREVANLSASLRERRTLLMSRVTEATLDGDFDKKAEALEAVNQWGLKQPKLAITQGEMLAAVKKGMKARAGILSPREEALKEAVKGEGP